MFSSVGRRLAILNGAVVLGILAIVSLGMLLFLERNLEAEVDRALQDRAAAAQVTWAGLFAENFAGQTTSRLAATQPVEDSRNDDHEDDDDRDERDERDDEDDHEDEDDDVVEELLQSGDTIAYALSTDGRVLADARGVPISELPLLSELSTAIEGQSRTSQVTIEGQSVRVYTEPVWINGTIAGAVQIAQGQGEYEAALRVVRLAILGGLILGGIVAVPAGLFLAHRSMQPIRSAFIQQRAFVADASHELRTPLTILRAQAEYLLRSPDLGDAERTDGYHILITEVDAMSHLVNDLLLLTRADSASMILVRGQHDLTTIARQAVSSFSEPARRAGLSISLDSAGPVNANFDPDRILQVMRILIDNAISYTPAGGSITVKVNNGSGKPGVSVSDTGIGIEANALHQVFDRFYRADQSRTRNSGGVGLGLAIAKTLIEAHGGEIHAISQRGVGSTFTFTLSS